MQGSEPMRDRHFARWESRCARCWQPWWSVPPAQPESAGGPRLCRACEALQAARIARGHPPQPPAHWPIARYYDDIAALIDTDHVDIERLHPLRPDPATGPAGIRAGLARTVAEFHGWRGYGDYGDAVVTPDGIVIAASLPAAAAAMLGCGWFTDNGTGIRWNTLTATGTDNASADTTVYTYPNAFALRRWITHHAPL